MDSPLMPDEEKEAVRILLLLPMVVIPEDLIVEEKDKRLLMRFFNCNKKVLTHRIYGWQQFPSSTNY